MDGFLKRQIQTEYEKKGDEIRSYIQLLPTFFDVNEIKSRHQLRNLISFKMMSRNYQVASTVDSKSIVVTSSVQYILLKAKYKLIF